MVDVFISYSRKDKDFVKVLHQALSHSKYETWVDWQDIPLTADWWEEIKRGIESADNFIFIISPDSIESKVCHQEVDHAATHNKRIIPIVRREGFDTVFIHEGLSRHNWLFFRSTDDFDQAFQSLINAINLDLPYVRTHTRLLQRAVEWEQSQRRDDLLLRGQDLQTAEQWLEESLANQQAPLVAELHKIFIHKGREVETANQRVLAAGERARRLVNFGSSVLALTLLGAVGVGLLAVDAYRSLNQAQIRALLTDADTAYKANPRTLDALMLSLQAGERLHTQHLVKDRQALESQLASTLLQTTYGIAEQDRLEGHKDNVLSVTPSPDGQHYVATSADGTASLWDRSGRLIKQLVGHGDWVREARYSPDGAILATVSDDMTLRFWTPEGAFIRSIPAHDNWIYSLDFSPDGKTLATTGKDGTVKLWTTEGQLLQTLVVSSEPVRSVRYLADGSFVTAGKDGLIRRWYGQTTPIAEWQAHAEEITALAVGPSPATTSSANQQLLASVSRDGTVKLWNLADQTLLQMLTPPRGDVDVPGELWSVALSPDGRWIAAGGEQTQIDIWRPEGTHLATLAGHAGRIRGLAFNAGPPTLISASEDNTLKLWRWPNPYLTKLKLHTDTVSDAAQSPDGELLAIASYDGTVSLWNLESQYQRTLPDLEVPINALAFSPDGMLAAAADQGQVALWQGAQGLPTVFTAHEADVVDLTFSADGQHLVTASDDGTAKLWSVANLQVPLVIFQGHVGPVYSVSFQADGQQIISAGEDGTVRIWQTTGQEIKQMKVSESRITNLQLSPDGSLMLVAGEDPVAHLLDLEGNEVVRLEGHTGPLWGAAFSPDGQRLATASEDDTIRLWHLDGRPIVSLKGHTNDVYKVYFSADGSHLISTSRDRTALIWDVTDVSLAHLLDQGCDWFSTATGESRVESLKPFCDR